MRGRCLAAPILSVALLILGGSLAQAQIPPELQAQFNDVVGSRVEALTILGGDYGASGGTFTTSGNPNRHADVSVSKFGGYGDIGDPRPLGETGLGWQPRLQGEMGYVDAKTYFTAGDFQGANIENETFAIQFGGGARFWFNDHLSLAPTFMGMYGHTETDFNQAQQAGTLSLDADTWTVRPAGNLQYVWTLGRTIFTLSSDFAYFHTESFETSMSGFQIRGNSEVWKNMLDVDIPLGKELLGHELRTGGYFSRSELYDDVKQGLNTTHIYEAHGRLVLDFLGKLWKVQWIGIGGSYFWGTGFTGWSVGGDIAFRF